MRFPEFFDSCLVPWTAPLIRFAIEFLAKVAGVSNMSQAKPVSKSKRRNKVGPALGAAGLSLSLAGGASATTGALTANMLAPNNEARQEVGPGEEEIYDVALATFYVINKESPAFQPRRQFAMGGGGGCGCCAGCAAATGSYGAWTPESDGDLSQRSIKPAHPPKRTHVSRSP